MQLVHALGFALACLALYAAFDRLVPERDPAKP